MGIKIKLAAPISEPQRQIIKAYNDPTINFIVVVCGRRAGKSFTNMNLAVKYALEHDNAKVLIVMPSSDQRSTIWSEFQELFAKAPFINKVDNSKYNVYIGNNSMIRFRLGSMPHAKSLKGNKFDFLIIDEASLMSPIVWEEYLSFTLATTPMDRLKVIFSTTPRGNDYIYKLYNLGLDPNYPTYTSIHAPSTSNPMVTQEFINDLRNTLPEKLFKQEVEAEFIGNSGSLFENIGLCVHPLPRTKDYYAGIDLGFQNDSTVVIIMDSNSNVVDYIRFNGVDMKTGAEKIAAILKKWDYPHALIELNTYQGIIEMLRDLEVENVRSFMTTSKSKKEIIEDLLVVFQNKEICIPNDDYFLSEFYSFGYVYNAKTRFMHYQALGSNHDDIVMATAICYHAKKILGNFSFEFL